MKLLFFHNKEISIQTITEKYFEQFNMIDYVIHSYNQLLDNLQNIIQKYDFKYYFNDIKKRDIKLSFKIQEVKYEDNKEMSITYLRQKSKDYLIRANIIMDIVFECEGKQKLIPIKDFFLLLPIVTNCKYDPILQQTIKQRWNNGQDLTQPGGDIIFKGVPYLVQNTLSQPFNKPIINKSDKDNQIIFANYLYQPDVMFGNSYYTTYALLQDKDNSLDLVMNFNQSQDRVVKKAQIPIFLIFRAYGIKTDEEALQFCNPENDTSLNYFLIDIIRNGTLHKQYYKNSKITQDDAKKLFIDLLRNQTIKASDDEIIKAIEKYIRPFSQSQEFAYTLGEIIKGIYKCYQTKQYSNRDSLHNKRVRMIGQQIYREILQSLQRAFNQTMYSLKQIVPEYNFDNFDKEEKFITLLSEKINYMSFNCSDILVKSFVNSSFDKVAPLQKTLNEQKNIILDIMQKRQIVIRSESMGGKVSWEQRKIQYDYYGFICPVSTPEGGGATGRYQSPAIYSYVSQSHLPDDIIEYIQKHKLYSKNYVKNSMPIKVNYNTIGFIKYKDMFDLYEDLMKYRVKNSLFDKKDIQNEQTQDLVYYKKDTITRRANHLFTSIYYDIENPHLGILTDYGRIMTPIMKGSWKGSLEDMITSGNLIYICPDMADNFIIKEFSSKDKYEWSFLPQGILGEYPAYCPFSGNQKAIRALYSTAQMKQNIAIPYTNPMNQMTNQQLTLTQPQSSICDSPFSRILFQQKPMQQIIYMCFKPYTFNQEDAIVSNQGYFYRGGSSTNSYKSFYSQLDNSDEKFTIPDKSLRRFNQNYSLLKDMKIGLQVKTNDVLIGKVSSIEGEDIDKSVVYDLSYETKYTTISSLKRQSDKDTERILQTQLSRYPTEGDKFVSRSAQKGTIGIILPEYELDILESGIVPTFFGNPQGLIKRETYGHQMEPVIGQYLAQTKQFTLDYGHDQYDISLLKEISQQPQLQGYSKYGNKLNMGFMGGPMMYCPQKHLVAQKIYAIDRAVKNKITNQPGQGRKRHGGMRIGNLEQSSFYAQGISQVIKDQAGINSSNSKWYICKSCHKNQVYKLAQPYLDKQNILYEYNCPTCGYTNNVIQMGFSYQANMLEKIMDSIGCQLIFKE